MDLKDFIKETISAIADATEELQAEYLDAGLIVNPPTDSNGTDVYETNSKVHTYRRIKEIEFDVAVSAESNTKGGGAAGLRVLSVELKGGAEHARSSETVSRVQFSIPIVLAPAPEEAVHIERRKKAQEEREASRRETLRNMNIHGGDWRR
jgi:hypothetical protein